MPKETNSEKGKIIADLQDQVRVLLAELKVLRRQLGKPRVDHAEVGRSLDALRKQDLQAAIREYRDSIASASEVRKEWELVGAELKRAVEAVAEIEVLKVSADQACAGLRAAVADHAKRDEKPESDAVKTPAEDKSDAK